MGISFTTQQRLDITRRQINIAKENAAYAQTTASLSAQQTALLNVDAANAVFYNFFRTQTNAYETESTLLNGIEPAEYSDGTISPFTAGDLSTSAQSPGSAGALFFPGTTPAYTLFIPQIVSAVNGLNNSVGTASVYEGNILTQSTSPFGLTNLLGWLLNGITGATTGSTTIATEGFTSGQLSVNDDTGFSVGDLIYVYGGSNSGIYLVNGITPGQEITPPFVDPILTVTPIIGSMGTFSPGDSVTNTHVGFTNTERNTLTSSTLQELLTNLTGLIDANRMIWLANINAQLTQLMIQNDNRTLQMTQNASATTANNAAIATLTTWGAKPNTGATGRFVNASLTPVQTLITTRQAYITSRASQILTAVGNVVDNGDGTYGGIVGSSYYERYKWLDVRLNRASGSARRYFDSSSSLGALNTLSTNNTNLATDYNAYFLTKAVTDQEGKPIIFITDVTGLSIGDTITAVSETQPEITRTIANIISTNQVQLNTALPLSYLVSDTTRIFKTLQ
jgi:hypothetical protein